MLTGMARRQSDKVRNSGGLPGYVADPWFEEGRPESAAASSKSLKPRAIAVLNRLDSVERFACAFSRWPLEVVGYSDPDVALQEFQRGHYDLALVAVSWGDDFDRSLIETLHQVDPDITVIALARSPMAADRLAAQTDLGLAAILVEPWTHFSLHRAVRAILYPNENETRVVEGALCPHSPSTGLTRLLPFTLPALLRLAGDLLFPKPNACQGALHHTTPPLPGGAAAT